MNENNRNSRSDNLNIQIETNTRTVGILQDFHQIQSPHICKVLIICKDKYSDMTKTLTLWLKLHRSHVTVVPDFSTLKSLTKEISFDMIFVDLSIDDYVFNWLDYDIPNSVNKEVLLIGYDSRSDQLLSDNITEFNKIEYEWLQRVSKCCPNIHYYIFDPMNSKEDMEIIMTERIQHNKINNLCDILDEQECLRKYHTRIPTSPSILHKSSIRSNVQVVPIEIKERELSNMDNNNDSNNSGSNSSNSNSSSSNNNNNSSSSNNTTMMMEGINFYDINIREISNSRISQSQSSNKPKTVTTRIMNFLLFRKQPSKSKRLQRVNTFHTTFTGSKSILLSTVNKESQDLMRWNEKQQPLSTSLSSSTLSNSCNISSSKTIHMSGNNMLKRLSSTSSRLSSTSSSTNSSESSSKTPNISVTY